MFSPVRYLLAMLAVLGLGTSQLLGIHAGYLCHCSGEPVMVNQADCDAAGCHEDAADHDGHGHEHDLPGSPHEHKKLTGVLLGSAFSPAPVQLPLVAVCPALPGVNCPFAPLMNGGCPERTVPEHISGCGPPPESSGILVARTTVMLV